MENYSVKRSIRGFLIPIIVILSIFLGVFIGNYVFAISQNFFFSCLTVGIVTIAAFIFQLKFFDRWL